MFVLPFWQQSIKSSASSNRMVSKRAVPFLNEKGHSSDLIGKSSKTGGSNPISYSKTPVGIFFIFSVFLPSKIPETVDAVGVQPTASIPSLTSVSCVNYRCHKTFRRNRASIEIATWTIKNFFHCVQPWLIPLPYLLED